MPRAEVGTPKYLANKMKSKGLQKLRWYCQMCQKQCRDENGFKCHTMSESHQRQLLLFADNSKRLIDDFSYEFAKGYIDILSRQFGTKRVNANKVYQEYITDKNHLHMNATRWVTLTGFVKWLGKTGKCKVDETEKGWFITYIDRSPETIEKEKRREKKLKMDKDDDERMAEFLERQRKHDEERGAFAKEGPLYTDLLRNDEEETLKLDLKLNSNKKQVEIIPLSKLLKRSVVDDDKKSIASSDSSKKRKTESKKSVLGEILEEEESKKEKLNRKQYWLHDNIVVKVVTKKLGDKYYKQKGVVKEVVNNYIGIVKLLDSGSKLKVDQEDLETVLPAIGKQVKVVNGAYRGEVAKLLSLDVDKFCASIEISAGLQMGKVLNNVQYEDICKLAEQ